MRAHFKSSVLWVAFTLAQFYGASTTVAANVLVALTNGGADPSRIAINAGDTVTWRMTTGFSNFTESLSSEWKSPLLTNTTATFSYRFTNAGFFVYRTAGAPGAITVIPWSNSPPAVTIITPVDGSVLSLFAQVPVVVTISGSETNVAEVLFLADGTVFHTVTSPPYTGLWSIDPGSPGALDTHTLSAVVVYKTEVSGAGFAGWSRPVRVSVGDGIVSPRLLPTGQFMFYYVLNSLPGIISYADNLPVGGAAVGGGFPHGDVLVFVSGSGLFVDFTSTNAPHRFYSLSEVFP